MARYGDETSLHISFLTFKVLLALLWMNSLSERFTDVSLALTIFLTSKYILNMYLRPEIVLCGTLEFCNVLAMKPNNECSIYHCNVMELSSFLDKEGKAKFAG